MKRPRQNVYTCRTCHKFTVTVDVDSGFTPENIKCTHCSGYALSCGYPEVIDPKLPDPTHEWYQPTGGEYLSLRPSLRQYVDAGGLLLRPRTQKEAKSH